MTADFFELFKVSKIATFFCFVFVFELFKVIKQPSKKQPSMHCLKHNYKRVDNITMSKKIQFFRIS